MKKQELMDLYAHNTMDIMPGVAESILGGSGRGGKVVSRDYVMANCLFSEVRRAVPDFDFGSVTCIDDLRRALSPAALFRLSAVTPCLAARYDELKPIQQDACFDDPDWVMTEKQNGVRGWLVNYKGDIHLYSRNYSDVDCGLLDYWGNIAQDILPTDSVYAIDVEIKFEPGADISRDLESLGLVTDSPLDAMVGLLHMNSDVALGIQRRFKEVYHKDLIVFRLIAPLFVGGINFLKRPLGAGMDHYDACIGLGCSLGFNVKPIARCCGTRAEKENFLDSVLNAGGEGVVFHNRRGEYCTSENRSITSYIKLKRSISGKVGSSMGDTIDGFVTGFSLGSNGTSNEGLISTLEFSIYVNDCGSIYPKVIANCPNLDNATKGMLTIPDSSGLYPIEWCDSEGIMHWVSLNPEFDGLVAELTGQALSSVQQQLEHPKFLRWVLERDAMSCVYTQEWLDSQTTNKGISYVTD